MMRQQWFTAINILGLSLGLASCLLIGLWVLDEYQIDGCYTNSDRVYKVLLTNPTGERKTGEISPIPLADALKAEAGRCYIDKKPRALDPPSDHAPVVIEIMK